MFLFNTLSKFKEEFKPIQNDNTVNIYCCGPTVYNLIHLGNARPIIVFDVLCKYLIFKNYKINFIQNFTDIDDKIIQIAKNEQVDYKIISNKYIEEYFKDIDNLKIQRANNYPKVTDNISEIINNIKILIEKNMAYAINNNVYFKSYKFENYGNLSKNEISKLISKKNTKQTNTTKKNILDFALWKSSNKDEPGWNSPWGFGRPGWHIECSTIISKYFPKTTIDIHGGGIDLIFPHHENEIAQSETLFSYKLSNFWIHNGFININNEKMAKSKKNFYFLRTLGEKYGYNIIRLFLISSHYKSNINFKENLLENTIISMKRIKTFDSLINYYIFNNKKTEEKYINIEYQTFFDKNKKDFFDAMDDDINTPEALAIFFEFIKKTNIIIMNNKKNLLYNFYTEVKKIFEMYCNILGIFFEKKQNNFNDKILNLIKLRSKYKLLKDYKNSDIIRKLLLNNFNIQIRDTKDGNCEIFFD